MFVTARTQRIWPFVGAIRKVSLLDAIFCKSQKPINISSCQSHQILKRIGQTITLLKNRIAI